MLQYKIPQNVGIEDKIVGPFSLRQLIIVAIGGGISYVLFAIMSKLYELNILEYILIALPALFALAAAMLKIHNVTFTKYILLILEFAIKPKKRMWDHRGISALVAPDLTEKAPARKATAQTDKERKSVNLRDLSVTLDSGGFEHLQSVAHEDIDEVNDDDLITEAYFGHKKTESDTQNMYWRTRDMQKKKLGLMAKMKQATATPQPAAVPATKEPAPAIVPASPPSPPPTVASTPAPAPEQGKTTAPSTGNKESVTAHLASVIKEARQNNEAKKQMEQEKSVPQTAVPAAVPTPPAIAPANPQLPVKKEVKTAEPEMQAPAKKRKRKRKKKPGAGPVRENTPVNTISKSAPPRTLNKPTIIQGETSFSDLSGGDEIEFNLD